MNCTEMFLRDLKMAVFRLSPSNMIELERICQEADPGSREKGETAQILTVDTSFKSAKVVKIRKTFSKNLFLLFIMDYWE